MMLICLALLLATVTRAQTRPPLPSEFKSYFHAYSFPHEVPFPPDPKGMSVKDRMIFMMKDTDQQGYDYALLVESKRHLVILIFASDIGPNSWKPFDYIIVESNPNPAEMLVMDHSDDGTGIYIVDYMFTESSPGWFYDKESGHFVRDSTLTQ